MATNKTQGRGKQQNRKASSSSRKPGTVKGQAHQPAPLLDDRTKRDIAAVVMIIVGVALLAMDFIGSDGVVTGALSLALRYCLGIGSYVLPFLLFVLAGTLLVRFEREMVPTRVAIGFALLLLAFLTTSALFTPGAEVDPNRLFIQQFLIVHGGYLGAGIGWALLKLFGFTVSLILVVGLVIVALLIIGFSVSSIIEKLRDRDEVDDDQANPFAHLSRLPSAHIKRAKKAARVDEGLEGPSAQVTHVLGSGEAHSAAKTKVLDAPATESRKRRPRRELREEAGVDDAPGQRAAQMTRKLGSRQDETDRGETQILSPAPKKKKATDVARPKPLEGFELPDRGLLNTSSSKRSSKESEATLRATGALLQETLADFGVPAEVVGWVPGPTVTLFKVDLPSGVRVNRVSNLTDDIALALAAPGVRIFAPVPGTNYVGIEVPNKTRETVLLGDVLKDAPDGPLQIAIGKDVEGNCIVSDLATMPHLLIGGTTGSGKSVAINGMIMSILMRATPSEVRMIMIDPKRVEFTPYNGIPHLYVPVVTEAREAASALSWAVAEMERRLKVFSGIGARNIGQYNAKAQKGLEINGTTAVEMPYLVIIIDELADLMMNVGKEVEFSISRLAQLARAAGIHLIVATQRPSTNVVTGLIKANITNRIAFNVASGIDSRVILDTPGAEHLIGLGDLLLSKPELAKPQRIQGCYVSEDEISAVVEKLKSQGEPEYHNDILKTNLITLGDSAPDGSGGSALSDDPLVWDAAEIVVSSGMGSTSNLQRRLSVGYSRAGRIMDLLEEKGVVGPPNGSKPREVLVDALELETIRAFEEQDS